MNIYLLSLVIVFSISNLYCLIKIAKLKNELYFMEEYEKYINRLEDNNLSMQIEMARTWEKNDKLQEEIEKLQSLAKTNLKALEKKNKKIVELEKQIRGE